MKTAMGVLGEKKGHLEQAENRLRTLKRDGGPKQSGFHEKTPMLLKAIQNEPSFSRPPVGPIGHHVSLLQPKWSSILENSFGGSLGAFIVTSKRDMDKLLNVMQRVDW